MTWGDGSLHNEGGGSDAGRVARLSGQLDIVLIVTWIQRRISPDEEVNLS